MPTDVPLVSCLCVTRGRVELLRHAIHCFDAQNYQRLELVVVYDEDDHATRDFIRAVQRDSLARLECPGTIRTVEAPAGTPLGALRNLAVDVAAGEYVCQWDDDDSYHPDRILTQMVSLLKHEAAACIMLRWMLWDGARGKLSVSGRRPWEGSLLCRKDKMPCYPAISRGEDTPAIAELCARELVAYLDKPDLYVYCFHGGNTWAYKHFAQISVGATEPTAEEEAAADLALPAIRPSADYPKEAKTLTVCMICRAEDNRAGMELARTASAHADEVVLVHTMQEDPDERGTAWADMHYSGALVKHRGFRWCDDFAAARNFALSHCTKDYVLWLDDDDNVPEESWRLIRAMLDKPGPLTAWGLCHFGLRVRNLAKEGWELNSFVQARIFPRLPGILWQGRVHESYVERAKALELVFVPVNIPIEHLGYADPEEVARKQARNHRLLLLEPPTAMRAYHLGVGEYAVGMLPAAEACFRDALNFPGIEPRLADQARYMIAVICSQQDRWTEIPALIVGSRLPDAVYIAGKYCLWEGNQAKAIEHFERFLSFGENIAAPLGTNASTFRKDAQAIVESLKGAAQ